MTNTKALLVAQFLRERAWWRLDSAGASPLHVGRSVVSLLDAAAYLQDVPDRDPHIRALEAAGWFRGGVFVPGPAGAAIIREWQLADTATAGPVELLAALAEAAMMEAARADAGLAPPRHGFPAPRAPEGAPRVPPPMPKRSMASFN